MEMYEVYKTLSRPPANALKQIQAGRMKGKTDISPQWRIEAVSEIFGLCGFGWYYVPVKMWTEPGAIGEVMCFVNIELFVKWNDEWSKPIFGTGGSTLIAKEKEGLHNSDEGFKMATTDALSVAFKQIGVGADIYRGMWDGSKYRDDAQPKVTTEKHAQKQPDIVQVIKAEAADIIKNSNLSAEAKAQFRARYQTIATEADAKKFKSDVQAALVTDTFVDDDIPFDNKSVGLF